MLVEKFDGKPVEDVKRFTAKDMLDLFGVRLTPNRQKCCLLCWRVLQAAIYSPLPVASSATRSGTASPARRRPAGRRHDIGGRIAPAQAEGVA